MSIEDFVTPDAQEVNEIVKKALSKEGEVGLTGDTKEKSGATHAGQVSIDETRAKLAEVETEVAKETAEFNETIDKGEEEAALGVLAEAEGTKSNTEDSAKLDEIIKEAKAKGFYDEPEEKSTNGGVQFKTGKTDLKTGGQQGGINMADFLGGDIN